MFHEPDVSKVPENGGATAVASFLRTLSPTQLLGNDQESVSGKDRDRAIALLDRAFSSDDGMLSLVEILKNPLERAATGQRPNNTGIGFSLHDHFFGVLPRTFIVSLALESSQILASQGETEAALKILDSSESLINAQESAPVRASLAFLRGRIANQVGDPIEAESQFRITLETIKFNHSSLDGVFTIDRVIDEVEFFCKHSDHVTEDSELFSLLDLHRKNLKRSAQV